APTRLEAPNPAVIDYVKRTIQLLCDWGYQFIKHDMSTGDFFGKLSYEMIQKIADNGWHFYDRTRTSAEIILDFYKAITETANKNGAVVLGCGCISHLGAGIFNVSRVGSDTSGRYFNDTRKYGVNSLAFRLIQNNAFYLIDADCVGITNMIKWKMNRQWMDLLAHSSSPLFVSCQPDVLSDEEFAELAQAMKTNSVQENQIRPIDWMENDTPMIWEIDGRIVKYNWYEELGEGSWQPEHEQDESRER
ncbi:MAG: alpha-galactosidase, partial [Clostridia bacterium]